MDHLALPSPVAKRRRSYTSEYRAKVVKASYEPGQSVAGVAQHYQINANMLHRWRKRFQSADNGQPSEFIRLPVPLLCRQSLDWLRLEVQRIRCLSVKTGMGSTAIEEPEIPI